jgi:5-methylcytosine-specific restriction endonuclease McrA
MIGLVISLAIQAISLVVRLIVFLVLLIVRLVGMLIAALVALVSAAVAFVAGLRFRRARPRGAGSLREPIDPELRWAVFRRDGYACLYCGSESNLSVDHIFPVSRGGGNDPDNLQTLCRDCNSRKGALV